MMSSIRDLLKRGREASTTLPLFSCRTLGDGAAWSPLKLTWCFVNLATRSATSGDPSNTFTEFWHLCVSERGLECHLSVGRMCGDVWVEYNCVENPEKLKSPLGVPVESFLTTRPLFLMVVVIQFRADVSFPWPATILLCQKFGIRFFFFFKDYMYVCVFF